MSKHRFMIELINKEDVIGECNAEVWEGEALANIRNFKPILTIPENPTNGDMLKAMFPNIRVIPVPEVNTVCVMDFILGEGRQISLDWWNAPYNVENEVNADE